MSKYIVFENKSDDILFLYGTIVGYIEANSIEEAYNLAIKNYFIVEDYMRYESFYIKLKTKLKTSEIMKNSFDFYEFGYGFDVNGFNGTNINPIVHIRNQKLKKIKYSK